MSSLDVLITGQLFAFLMIFARLGTAFMILPGFSDLVVPSNIRLFMALTLSLVLGPVVRPYLPMTPPPPLEFGIMIIMEMLVGLFIGLMAQVMLNAVNVAGNIISQMMSLSNAFIFNPQMAAQSTIVGSFLSLLTIVLILVTNLHHMFIIAIVDSYQVFAFSKPLLFGDLSDAMAQALADSFHIGLQMCAPFVIVGMGVYVAMGLVARLVPQIQVFIVSIPVQVLVGLAVLLTSLSGMMLYFLAEYQEYWQKFL